MSEQFSLLDWKPPAEVVPFPSHRSHGATAMVARAIADMETAKRTGRLNSLRAQTRKRMEPIFGTDTAERAADDLVRMVRIHMAYCGNLGRPSHKQIKSEAVILSLSGQRIGPSQHGYGGGEAGASGQGTTFLAGVWGEQPHNNPSEYDAARAREGGAA